MMRVCVCLFIWGELIDLSLRLKDVSDYNLDHGFQHWWIWMILFLDWLEFAFTIQITHLYLFVFASCECSPIKRNVGINRRCEGFHWRFCWVNNHNPGPAILFECWTRLPSKDFSVLVFFLPSLFTPAVSISAFFSKTTVDQLFRPSRAQGLI